MADPRSDKLRSARLDIAEHVSRRLGFGPLPTMPPGLRTRLDQEVDEAIGEWRLAVSRDPGLAPRTELQHLLAAFHALDRGGSS